MKKLFIGIIIFLISIFLIVYFLVYIHKKQSMKSEKYKIKKIVQKGDLPTQYIAEILNLSFDKKKNIYLFDEREASSLLTKNPFIKRARVKKVFPSTIYVSYKLRKPYVRISDFKNLAMDRRGFLFPIAPFLKDHGLISLYLGDIDWKNFWEKPLFGKKIDLARDILEGIKSIEDKSFRVLSLDLSEAFSKNLGKREIVLKVEHYIYQKDKRFIFPRFLRLSLKNYKKQLGNYIVLNREIEKDYKRQLDGIISRSFRFSPKCVDLRIENVAFIDR